MITANHIFYKVCPKRSLNRIYIIIVINCQLAHSLNSHCRFGKKKLLSASDKSVGEKFYTALPQQMFFFRAFSL